MESFLHAPEVFKPTQNTVLNNVGWLNVAIIIVVLFVIWHHVCMKSGRDRFDSSYNAVNASAARTGFASLVGGFTASRDGFYADTPYPYDPSCLDTGSPMQYAASLIMQNNPTAMKSPLYPQWEALLEKYLQLSQSNTASPSQSAAAAASSAWNDLQAFQSANDFDPMNPPTAQQIEIKTAVTKAVASYLSSQVGMDEITQAVNQYMASQPAAAAAPATAANVAAIASNITGAVVTPAVANAAIAAAKQEAFGGPQAIRRSSFGGPQAIRRSGFEAAPSLRNWGTGNFTARPPLPTTSSRFASRPALPSTFRDRFDGGSTDAIAANIGVKFGDAVIPALSTVYTVDPGLSSVGTSAGSDSAAFSNYNDNALRYAGLGYTLNNGA